MLICGIGGEIGAAIIKYLIPRSKILISSSHSDISTLQKQDVIPDKNIHIPLNITQENNNISFFMILKQKFGRLYVLINTIGRSLYTHSIEDFPLGELKEILKVNLTTAFLLTKYAFRVIKANKPRGENIVHFIFSSVRKISPHKVP